MIKSYFFLYYSLFLPYVNIVRNIFGVLFINDLSRLFKSVFSPIALLSAHRLHIETGRYNKIPRDNRLCKNFSPKKIEDEVHFLLKCPKYTPMRENWLKDINF